MIHIILQTCVHVAMYYNYSQNIVTLFKKNLSINLVKYSWTFDLKIVQHSFINILNHKCV
jgi:hypothetical protein